MKQLTGPQLFLHYAWPCAEEKRKAGKISQGDFDQLKLDLEQNRHPNGWLLEHGFKTASYALYKFAKPNKNPWALETVVDYWRYNHQGNTPVIFGMIVEITEGKIMVLYDSRRFEVSNPYKLSLEQFSVVSIHCDMIIEVIE